MLCPTRKRPRSGPWASSVTARARPPKSKKVSSRFDTRDGYRFSREVNIVSPLLRGGAKTLPRPRGDPVKVFKASGSHRRWPACLDAEGKPWVAFSRRGHSAPGRLGLGRVAHPSGHTERGSGDRSLRLVKRASRGCKPARRARARRSDGPSRRSLAIRPRDSKATPGERAIPAGPALPADAALLREHPVDQVLDLGRVLGADRLVLLLAAVVELDLAGLAEIVDELGLGVGLALVLGRDFLEPRTLLVLVDRMALGAAVLLGQRLRGGGVHRSEERRV